MRSSKVLCLTLAALNVAVVAARLVSDREARFEPRVPLSPRSAEAVEARGDPVPFRLEGELSRPAAAPAPSRAPPPESPIDSSGIAYLGTMTSPELRSEYFFKDSLSGRVYSTRPGGSMVKVLEASEKEFLIEIEGTKYRVAR